MASPGAVQCPFGHQHPELMGSVFVVFFDRERKILRASKPFCELIGFQEPELLGLKFEKLLPKDVEFNIGLWNDFLKDGQLRNTLLLQTKRGAVIGVFVNSRRFGDGCMASAVRPIISE
jgi:PAS domain-containing protein